MKTKSDLNLCLFELKQNTEMLDAIMGKIRDMMDTESINRALYILLDNLERVHKRTEEVINEIESEPLKEEPQKLEDGRLDNAILDLYVKKGGDEVYFARKGKYDTKGVLSEMYYEVGITGKGSKRFDEYNMALSEYRFLRDSY